MSRLQMVVGLAFTADRSRVALIYKERGPEVCRDKWNGVGGKIEREETPRAAMVREFREETGVLIPSHRWQMFAKVCARDYDLFFFTCADDCVTGVRTVETEQVALWDCESFDKVSLMDNIRWMIPMLRDTEVDVFTAPF